MTSLSRERYAALYGPTTGDLVRLADTDLWVRVEDDDTEPGEEMLGGCAKTARDGLLVAPKAGRDSALDMVILGVLLLDPVLGVRKTNIGIKEGRVVGVGRAGNPEAGDGVRWNDPAFGVRWPFSPAVIADRDASYPDFSG